MVPGHLCIHLPTHVVREEFLQGVYMAVLAEFVSGVMFVFGPKILPLGQFRADFLRGFTPDTVLTGHAVGRHDLRALVTPFGEYQAPHFEPVILSCLDYQPVQDGSCRYGHEAAEYGGTDGRYIECGGGHSRFGLLRNGHSGRGSESQKLLDVRTAWGEVIFGLKFP